MAANIFEASRIVRQAAVSAGGLVIVARNPVTVKYAWKNAAVGGISQAIELGKIKSVNLKTVGGFDVGSIMVFNGKEPYELTFWKEYMCLENQGQRIATFPDLIATINIKTGLPLTTSEIREGQNVAILHVPRQKLKLGAGMKDSEIFKPIEEATHKQIIKYSF